jgi:hypothetical protein
LKHAMYGIDNSRSVLHIVIGWFFTRKSSNMVSTKETKVFKRPKK